MGGGSGENSGASGLAGGATLERPGTTQRSGGRVAMTVLRPHQPAAAAQPEQQPATALPPLALSQQAQATLPTTLAAPRRSLVGVKQVCAVLPGLSFCTTFAYQLS